MFTVLLGTLCVAACMFLFICTSAFVFSYAVVGVKSVHG